MRITQFLTQTHGKGRLDWTDYVSYTYLFVGLFTMFAPIVWLVMSSLKTESAVAQFPPTFLPYSQQSVKVMGHEQPLPLFLTKTPDGERPMAQVMRLGIEATMVDPAKPDVPPIKVNIKDRKPINELKFALENYTEVFGKFSFGKYLFNSVFITIVATLLTLLVNSMAAFALSKYQFKGQKFVFGLIIATLMIPPTIILVPVFLVINTVGLLNSLWGVIIPAIATPTGVFLLRQYMLTIPDELLEAARMDHASEWRIYWKIILPLAAPALAVLDGLPRINDCAFSFTNNGRSPIGQFSLPKAKLDKASGVTGWAVTIAAAALHHPNICPVYDVGTVGDVPFITTRYLEGETLAVVAVTEGGDEDHA